MIITDNYRNFAEREKQKFPRGMSMYGYNANRQNSPWEISQVVDAPRCLPGIHNALKSVLQEDAGGDVPDYIDRSVFSVLTKPRPLPLQTLWYYIVCHNNHSWGIKKTLRELKLSPPAPAKRGQLAAATDSELALICRNWRPEPGTTYAQLFPIIAIGGNLEVRYHGVPKDAALVLDVTKSGHTVLRAERILVPDQCSILVRSVHPL